MNSRCKSLLVMFAFLCSLGSQAQAQAPPPNVTAVYPPGGKRGTSVEVTCTGAGLAGAGKMLFGEPLLNGEIIAGPQNNDGTFKAKITIAVDTPCGVFDFRVATNRGLTGVERFAVGNTDELEEKEPNNDRKAAQRLATPSVVYGRINGAEDVDWFLVSGKKGEEFIFDVMASRASSGLDADLFLYDTNGRLLASNGDFNKLDPLVAYKFPADGDYYVLLRDFNFRGGANFTYRLTVGALPYVYSIVPSGGAFGSKTRVKFFGVNLNGSDEGEVDLTEATKSGTRLVYARTAAGVSNAVPFAIEHLREAVKPQKTPNHTMTSAMNMPAPGVMNGQLDTPSEADYYSFEAKQGMKVTIDIMSYRLGSPMDPVLDLYDDKSAVLVAENDDTLGMGRDTKFNFEVPRDGTYVIRVRDRHERAGDRFFYRLKIDAQTPDFALQTNPASPFVRTGGTLPLTVTVQRLNGFSGAVELDLPNLPKGVKASAVTVPTGQNQAVITLTGAPDAPADAALLIVRGKSGDLERESSGQETIFVNNQPQAQPAALMAVSVGGAPEFTLAGDPAQPTVVRGKTVSVTVTIKRKEGFKGAIAVAALGLSGGITATTPTVAENASSATITITVPAGAAPGRYRLIPTGTFSPNTPQRIVFSTEPIMLTVTEK